MSERPPIKGSPEPDYSAKVDLKRCDTDEIEIIDLKRDAKKRAIRRPKEIAAGAAAIAVIIGALATGAVKVIYAFKGHSDRGDYIESRLDNNEKRLDGHETRLNNCCSK